MIVVGFLVAAAAGTLVRWQATERLPRPAGTFFVNLVGAALLGWLSGSSEATQTVIGVAAIGSLTTFSTLLVELLDLWSSRRLLAVGYGLATVIGGVGVAWIGLTLG